MNNSKLKKLFGFFLLAFPLGVTFAQQKENIIINLKEKGADISPSMYGVFFEEINHAGDGGLYGELVQNRSFEEKDMPEGYHKVGDKLYPKPVKYHLTGEIRDRSYRWNTEKIPAWSLNNKSAVSMEVTTESPRFSSAPHNLKLTIKDASSPVQLINSGYWGMNLEKGKKYLLRTIIRTSKDYKGNVIAKLVDEHGNVLASSPVNIHSGKGWIDVKNTLITNGSDIKGRLLIEFTSKGTVWLDYVSLFPEDTFNKRPNGLRKDVAETLAGLKPAFFRWPGGCVVEGITLNNRFEWKKTLGDPAARPGEYSTWGYRCSYGMGYYEMLQYCEDIGAKAMFVCNVGLSCQFRMGEASPEDKISYYLNDCLDAIEYALGDKTTKWGARRAADGHPQAFPLKYVEIGNENWGPEYDKRFDIFYKAIKKKYPQLVLIYNEMPQPDYKPQITKTDMIDPHWYVDPYFFFSNTTLFDKYERGKYTVYVGEYACNRNVGGGNMFGALSEAAFIGGMERNGDLVKMASYAPLFENSHDRSWATNLIWINTHQVMGRSSYYVQKMAAENRPDYNLKSNIIYHQAEPVKFSTGYLGVAANKADMSFKDFTLTKDGKTSTIDDTRASFTKGDWNVKDGILSSSNGLYMLNQTTGGTYTLEFKVKKGTQGRDCFLLYLGSDKEGKNGFKYNVGMWGNTRAELARLENGEEKGVLTDCSMALKPGEWQTVKVNVTPETSELYIDGKKLLSHKVQSVPLQFIASGYDEKNKEVILKIVNATNKDYPTSIHLNQAETVENTGKVITLSSQNAKDENSFEYPKKIYPEESTYNGFGKQFDYTFKPYSYTILRIKAK